MSQATETTPGISASISEANPLKAGESTVIPKNAKLTKDQLAKLEAGYRFVEVPAEDIYEYAFEGFWINGYHYKPGKHLLRADFADEAERILKTWDAANRRLLRTTPHRQTLSEIPNTGVTAPPIEA